MADLEFAELADGTQVAYNVLSTGFSQWLVWVPGLLYGIESIEDDIPYARFMHGLTEVANVVTIERQGIGASDMVDFEGDVYEQWADGVAAVLDDIGIATATVAGYAVGAATAAEFGLRHANRATSLVLMHLSIGDFDQVQETMVAVVARDEEMSDAMLALTAPSRHDDDAYNRWNLEAGRRGASPRIAARYWESVLTMRGDLLDRLSSLQPRTMVLQRRDAHLQPLSDAKIVAETIPDSVLRVVDGADMIPNAGDVDSLIAEIAEFLTGERRIPASEKPLAAMLFTDLVDSTKQVSEGGDERWRAKLDRHDELVARSLSAHGGLLVKSTGDGILATFDTASRALDGARELRSALNEIGLAARMGVHVAEIEHRGDDVAGVGVHLAARVMSVAAAGEILASDAVRLVTLGSDFRFTHHDTVELKGLDGTWNIFRLSWTVITYPDLPVADRREEILAAIEKTPGHGHCWRDRLWQEHAAAEDVSRARSRRRQLDRSHPAAANRGAVCGRTHRRRARAPRSAIASGTRFDSTTESDPTLRSR